MIIKSKYLVNLLAVTVIGMSQPALAQSTDASDLSADELEQLFQKQKTRGLVLAPNGAQAATETETTQTPEAAPTPQETYVELAEEEQVNVQVSFDFDSAALRDDQKPKLSTLCEVMKTVDVDLFRIVGHTDASGSADYNERLSLLRAQEVKRYMVGSCGIAETRLEAVGVGEEFPFNRDDPRADVNRRVEFQALR